MKKRIRIISFLFALSLCITALCGCGAMGNGYGRISNQTNTANTQSPKEKTEAAMLSAYNDSFQQSSLKLVSTVGSLPAENAGVHTLSLADTNMRISPLDNSSPGISKSSDWAAAYKQVISNIKYQMTDCSMCNYSVYDTNEDGIPELFLNIGNCEADRVFKVYSFSAETSAVQYYGSVSGSSAEICGIAQKNAFLVHFGKMGYEIITLVTLENGVLKGTVIYEAQVLEYHDLTALPVFALDDFRGLNWVANEKDNNQELIDHITQGCPCDSFYDLDNTAWYHTYVDFALENGLMNGVDRGKFEPDGSLTRAMLVTILYRVEGEPSVSGTDNPFRDVPAGQWYTKAVIWAAGRGIVNGVSATRFAPDENITREQIATILHRYSGSPAVSGNLNIFRDSAQVSAYAKKAMQWAVGLGIINGSDGALEPGKNATRIQIAAILCRYLSK